MGWRVCEMAGWWGGGWVGGIAGGWDGGCVRWWVGWRVSVMAGGWDGGCVRWWVGWRVSVMAGGWDGGSVGWRPTVIYLAAAPQPSHAAEVTSKDNASLSLTTSLLLVESLSWSI